MSKILHKIVSTICCISLLGITVPAVLAEGETSQIVGTPPTIDAQTAILIDGATKQVIFDKGMHDKMYPASTTKIMTGLLAAEYGNQNDMVQISKNISKAQGASVSCIGLEPGEQLTQDSLMYTMFLSSACDSAFALAEHIGGSEEHFVEMMNLRAQELGALGTHFANPDGLPDVNNYTTAYDLALIARAAVMNSDALRYFGATKFVMPADNIRKTSTTYGTIVNMLRPDSMYYYNGIIAAKSGWIVMSGYTLVTVARRGERTLICVQLKGTSKSALYEGSKALFDFGFAQPQPVVSSTASVSSVQSTVSSQTADSAIGQTDKKPDNTKISPTFIMIVISAAAAVALIIAVTILIRTLRRRLNKPVDIDLE